MRINALLSLYNSYFFRKKTQYFAKVSCNIAKVLRLSAKITRLFAKVLCNIANVSRFAFIAKISFFMQKYRLISRQFRDLSQKFRCYTQKQCVYLQEYRVIFKILLLMRDLFFFIWKNNAFLHEFFFRYENEPEWAFVKYKAL